MTMGDEVRLTGEKIRSYELGDAPIDYGDFPGDIESAAEDMWADLTELVGAVWRVHDVEHVATRMYCDNALCVHVRELSSSLAE